MNEFLRYIWCHENHNIVCGRFLVGSGVLDDNTIKDLTRILGVEQVLSAKLVKLNIGEGWTLIKWKSMCMTWRQLIKLV
jgi:hypothetical protein